MKQLELQLKIKRTSSFDDVPTLKQLIDKQKETLKKLKDLEKERPKHLSNLSEKNYQLLKELHKGKL